jgi:DegV family protein with EDD domain
MNNCIVPFERVYRAGALLSKFPARDLRKKGFVMSVRIITDSASDMTPVEHPALRVLPLSVTFGTDVYMDGVDIDHQRFYEMLVERDELPKTGQVNPYAFSQAIAEAREAGDEAVIITVGAKLSGTNQSARTALAEAPGGDVFVVDSNNVTLGERVLVEYALRLVDEGRSAAQIAAAVEAVRDRVVVIGLLETLEYLVRGGRLSAAAGAVGTLLNVKPVVAVEDGLIVQLGKARGSKNGRNLLNQKVEKAGGIDFSMPLALGYTGLSDAVLKKYIEDSAALWAGHTEGELPIHTIGATIGTHVGPGAVAVAFFRPAN